MAGQEPVAAATSIFAQQAFPGTW